MLPTALQTDVHARLAARLRTAKSDHDAAVADCEAAAGKVTLARQTHGLDSLEADMARLDFDRADDMRAKSWAALRTAASKLTFASNNFFRHPIGGKAS
jgi:hypothetical protein